MMMNCSNKTKVEGEREVRCQNITKKQEISLKTQNIMKEESVSFLLWSTVQIEQRVERETEKTNVNTRFREMWNGIRVKSEVFWSFFRILIHPLIEKMAFDIVKPKHFQLMLSSVGLCIHYYKKIFRSNRWKEWIIVFGFFFKLHNESLFHPLFFNKSILYSNVQDHFTKNQLKWFYIELNQVQVVFGHNSTQGHQKMKRIFCETFEN